MKYLQSEIHNSHLIITRIIKGGAIFFRRCRPSTFRKGYVFLRRKCCQHFLRHIYIHVFVLRWHIVQTVLWESLSWHCTTEGRTWRQSEIRCTITRMVHVVVHLIWITEVIHLGIVTLGLVVVWVLIVLIMPEIIGIMIHVGWMSSGCWMVGDLGSLSCMSGCTLRRHWSVGRGWCCNAGVWVDWCNITP